MRTTFLTITIAAASMAILSQVVVGGQKKSKPEDDSKTAFVCRLDAFTPAERLRHQALWRRLKESAQEVKELADGYAIRFPGDREHFSDVAEFIAGDRRCCSFVTFELEAAGEDQPLWLRLRGSQEVKEFLKAEVLRR